MLNTAWLKFRALFRAAFFLPVVTPMVVVAIIFTILYSQEGGIMNYLIARFGLEPVPWLVSENWSKPSLAILLVWRWTGYNMVLMLAGLQGISQEYYEAARIDGAGPFHCRSCGRCSCSVQSHRLSGRYTCSTKFS